MEPGEPILANLSRFTDLYAKHDDFITDNKIHTLDIDLEVEHDFSGRIKETSE